MGEESPHSHIIPGLPWSSLVQRDTTTHGPEQSWQGCGKCVARMRPEGSRGKEPLHQGPGEPSPAKWLGRVSPDSWPCNLGDVFVMAFPPLCFLAVPDIPDNHHH